MGVYRSYSSLMWFVALERLRLYGRLSVQTCFGVDLTAVPGLNSSTANALGPLRGNAVFRSPAAIAAAHVRPFLRPDLC